MGFVIASLEVNGWMNIKPIFQVKERIRIRTRGRSNMLLGWHVL